MKALIIIPTYNERVTLPPLVRSILAIDPSYEVLVVDDGSPDGTGELAEALARETRRVSVIHRQGKQGLGTAYIAGFQTALAKGYDVVVEMDADFSHNPADLPRLIAPVADGRANLVLGSRWASGGGTRNWPWYRQLISRGGSWYARLVLGVGIRDLTGGFKCFHRKVLEAIDLDSVHTKGYGFQIELTYRAQCAGFRVKEIPITFTERVYGESKMSTRIIAEAITLVWKLRLGELAAAMAGKVSTWQPDQPVRREIRSR